MSSELTDRLRADAASLKLVPKTTFRPVQDFIGGTIKLKSKRTCLDVASDIEKLIQLWERK